MEQYTILFSREGLALVMEALGELQFKRVHSLINDIARQADEQAALEAEQRRAALEAMDAEPAGGGIHGE